MADRILVLYGSYRFDRMGIRLADFLVAGLRDRGNDTELIDAKVVGLPILERMYKEYPHGTAVLCQRSCSLARVGGECGPYTQYYGHAHRSLPSHSP